MTLKFSDMTKCMLFGLIWLPFFAQADESKIEQYVSERIVEIHSDKKPLLPFVIVKDSFGGPSTDLVLEIGNLAQDPLRNQMQTYKSRLEQVVTEEKFQGAGKDRPNQSGLSFGLKTSISAVALVGRRRFHRDRVNGARLTYKAGMHAVTSASIQQAVQFDKNIVDAYKEYSFNHPLHYQNLIKGDQRVEPMNIFELSDDISPCVAEAASERLEFADFDAKYPHRVKVSPSSIVPFSYFRKALIFAGLLFQEVHIFTQHYMRYRTLDQYLKFWHAKLGTESRSRKSLSKLDDLLREQYTKISTEDKTNHVEMFGLLNPYGHYWTSTYEGNRQIIDYEKNWKQRRPHINGQTFIKISFLNLYGEVHFYKGQPQTAYALEALLDYNAFLPYLLGRLDPDREKIKTINMKNVEITRDVEALDLKKDRAIDSTVKCLVKVAREKLEALPEQSGFPLSKQEVLKIFSDVNYSELGKLL